jgi:hypothetical protein
MTGVSFGKLRFVWDNKKVDLSLVTNTPATLEATGRAWSFMPLPAQIDQCVNAALADHPNERSMLILACTRIFALCKRSKEGRVLVYDILWWKSGLCHESPNRHSVLQ